MLAVHPIESFGGTFCVPSSKPETQRALLTGALASGTSIIRNALICNETEFMMEACRNLGAKITINNNTISVTGVGQYIHFKNKLIDCHGSALVFRVFAALGGLATSEITLTGNETLRHRPMKPLLSVLEDLGAKIEYPEKLYAAPCTLYPSRLSGGLCRLPANISSQYITALLYLGVLLNEPLRIELENVPHSLFYIRQTVDSLQHAGAHVSMNETQTRFDTAPSTLKALSTKIYGDFTSASYLVACALLFPGTSIFTNIDLASLQGEKIIFDVVKQLGIDMRYDAATHELMIHNETGCLSGNIEISVKDGPNITPTLAAIGAYVEGEFVVRGAMVCQYHKCDRINTMIDELRRFGVDIDPLYEEGLIDGFIIRGKRSYSGNVTFNTDFKDHRIIMSLFILALRADATSFFSYNNMSLIRDSFPNFMDNFELYKQEIVA